jgi:photosystem II stability/assembly factor-like uncharacterized protein
LTLAQTTDAGRSWSAQPLPAELVAAADRRVNGQTAYVAEQGGLNVYFANRSDGWIYGELGVARGHPEYVALVATLWSTHNGGRSWQRQSLSGIGHVNSILDIDSSHGAVYLLETNGNDYGVTITSSPVSVDRWRVVDVLSRSGPAGGSEESGAFVLHGRAGWAVAGNDRGTIGASRLTSAGRWVTWTPPCAGIGGSFSIPAASTSSDLAAACLIGGYGGYIAKPAPAGEKLGSSWLYLSRNGGVTFSPGPELAATYASVEVLASPAPNVILIGRDTASSAELLASFDGGAHWNVVDQGQPAYSQPFEFQFTNPSEGVGLLQPASGRARLIITHDGGHHWATVAF